MRLIRKFMSLFLIDGVVCDELTGRFSRKMSKTAEFTQQSNGNIQKIGNETEDDEFTVTWKRWLVLAIVSLINMGVAMVWLCFSPIAYKAATYYDVDLIVINTLSLIFLVIAIPCGLLVMWVMEKYGLRACILLCAWLGCIGSLIRICSTIESLSKAGKLSFLFLGQFLAALGSPFGLYTPAKLAGSWFPEDQRMIANTIAASSNPVGVILTGIISPLFQQSNGEYDMQLLLITCAAPVAAGALLATFCVTSDGPAQPPSYAGTVKKTDKVWDDVKVVVKNKMYMLLVLVLGTGLGVYSSFATLLEQVLCPWGYDDQMSGASASILTLSGIIGAVIISAVVDKTRNINEALKAVYLLTSIGVIVFSFTHYIYMGYGILGVVSLIGFFAFTIYPVGTEMAAECTYPIGTGTSTGLIQLSGQLQSVILILLLSSIGQEMDPEVVIENDSKCHHNHTETGDVIEDNVVYDMRIPVWVCAASMTLTSVLLLLFFRPSYKRMEAEKIHNYEMYKRRMSKIPSSTVQNGNCTHDNEALDVSDNESEAPSVFTDDNETVL